MWVFKKGSRRKMETALFVALSGGVMWQGTLACVKTAGDTAAASVDFCFLFNCSDGFFNGLVQPCDAPTFTLFIDCDELTQPFGSGLFGDTAVPTTFGGFRPPPAGGGAPAGQQAGGAGGAGGVGGAGAGGFGAAT